MKRLNLTTLCLPEFSFTHTFHIFDCPQRPSDLILGHHIFTLAKTKLNSDSMSNDWLGDNVPQPSSQILPRQLHMTSRLALQQPCLSWDCWFLLAANFQSLQRQHLQSQQSWQNTQRLAGAEATNQQFSRMLQVEDWTILIKEARKALLDPRLASFLSAAGLLDEATSKYTDGSSDQQDASHFGIFFVRNPRWCPRSNLVKRTFSLLSKLKQAQNDFFFWGSHHFTAASLTELPSLLILAHPFHHHPNCQPLARMKTWSQQRPRQFSKPVIL